MIKITKAQFLTSCPTLKECPKYDLPEVALVGRSNVGKSSFINAITNRKSLAKTSNTPGKTRLINLYNINDALIIADLPGYGYAKVSKTEQARWAKNLEEYILKRESLKFVIQFIDARHEVQNNDLQMREWLDYHNIPVVTVAAKVDAVSKNALPKIIGQFSQVLKTDVVGFSAKTGDGREKVIELLFQDTTP